MAKKRQKGKRLNHGLRGSALIHAVEAFRARGLKEKEIFKRCGYRDHSLFSRALNNAYTQRQLDLERIKRIKARQLDLEQIEARDSLDRSSSRLSEARDSAQRRLARGEKLTKDEFNALPDFQKIALLKSDTQQILKPQVLKGNALLEKVRMLSGQDYPEINIAIKCGYGSEKVGQFRGELARVIGCKIAPLDRLLDQARRSQ